MMRIFDFGSLSIILKLKRLQAVTVGLALFFTLLVTGISQTFNSVLENKRDGFSLANVIAYNADAALLFNDQNAGQEILSSLRGQPNILSAQLYDKHGSLFASYESQVREEHVALNSSDTPFQTQTIEFSFSTQVLKLPIINGQDTIGSLRLAIDMKPVWQRVLTSLLQVSVVSLLAYFLAGLFGKRMSAQIAEPLIRLSQLAERVSGEENYEIRASGEGDDEVGRLVKSFNQMIQQIQTRDQKLLRHREWLENEVDLRTAELRTAMEDAQAANQAKTQFLASMSHEIRTPMNGVLGMLELLLNKDLNEGQKRLAEKASHSAKFLLGIINQILDFSRIEAGKLSLSQIDFDLRRLLEETAEMFIFSANRKNLELIVDIPADFDFESHGDPDKLRQVLTNLIGNAIKFTESGEIIIRVRSSFFRSDQGQSQLIFEVCDTGPGIPEEIQQHIFERFTQEDSSITRRYGGTGLGLAISKQLVELMGGELRVDSRRGQGARFYFALPMPVKPRFAQVNEDIFTLRGISILIYVDNDSVRNVLQGHLSHWRSNVVVADRYVDVINTLREARKDRAPYRIVITDWRCCSANGFAFLDTVRGEGLLSSSAMVVLCSDDDSLDKAITKIRGRDFVLNKPIFRESLAKCLLSVLEGKADSEGFASALQNTAPIRPFRQHVLVADDNATNLEVTRGFLLNLGCTSDAVSNGSEALAAVKLNHYDLLLMDCHMPEMDGFTAARYIRRLESELGKARMPIVALTADVLSGIDTQCREAGMDGYITKPLDRGRLQQELSYWFNGNKISTDSHASETHDDVAESQIGGVLDREVLCDLQAITYSDGTCSLLEKVINVFLESNRDNLDKIDRAVNDLNYEELTKITHALKSSSGNVGAVHLADLYSKMENAASERDPERLLVIYPDLVKEFHRVIAALQEELRRLQRNSDNLAPAVEPHRMLGLQNKTILLVDDDPNFTLTIKEILRASGFHVMTAASGSDALSIINLRRIDLIVLDALMEGLNGFDTCEAIKKIPEMTDVPILMLTGLEDVDSINRAYQAGASDFIVKPVNSVLLQYHIQFLLRASINTAELRNVKQQLDAAQKMARLGYWIWYVDEKKFVISPYLAELCVIDEKKFDETLESFLKLVVPEDRVQVENAIYALLEGDFAPYIEYGIRAGSGEIIAVSQETTCMRGSHEKIVAGTVQDISRQKANEQTIQKLAYFDELTGLASRAFYQARIDQFIKSAKRNGEKFAFLYLDLDEFKYINDSFGHNVGDHYLQEISKRIKSVIREVDFAARLGGDEFCVIVSNLKDVLTATEVAERCLQEVHRPLSVGAQKVNPRVSIGIAVYPQDGQNEHDLMKAADAAMYSAKMSGKQCYAYYRPEMTEQALRHLQEEQFLREAVATENFLLYYQPIVNLETGSVLGVEALLRWRHPIKGLVGPGDFIGIAENHGLIKKIGTWVFKEACAQFAKWQNLGLGHLSVAVNISASHFQDPQMLVSLRANILQTNIPAEKIVIEITESVRQDDYNTEIFSQLRKIGVGIALDDFGTGYSSLASLKLLPIDCLKIDRAFVQDLTYDSKNLVLLQAITNIAKSMKYDLIAEGVERIDQLILLKREGFSKAQGYLFSKPVLPDEIPGLVERGFKHLQFGETTDTNRSHGDGSDSIASG